MTEQESKASAVVKRNLELQYGHTVRATLTVASADWPFQVNFTDVQCNTNSSGNWDWVPEGFGEVFLSQDLCVIQVNIGP